MSIKDALEGVQQGKLPPDEAGRVEYGPDGGEFTDIRVPEKLTSWDHVFERFSLDPDEFVIVDDTVRISHWQQSKRTDGGDRDVVDLYSYRARFRRRDAYTDQPTLDDMVERLRGVELPGRVPRSAPGVTLFVGLADWQLGKAVKDDTPVFTPAGWVNHGDIRPGDYVFGPDGKPKRVLEVTGSTEQDLYEVQFDRGVSITTTGDHIWEGVRAYHPAGHKKNGGPTWEKRRVQMTTKELMALPQSSNRGRRWITRPLQVDLPDPIQMPEAELPVDPHLLGLWLGDGDSCGGAITKGAVDKDLLLQYGYDVSNSARPDVCRVRVTGLTTQLRELGVLGDKHIPELYLMASAEQRMRLLQGLMDTDGSCSPEGGAEFSNTNPRIIEGVRFLLSSLGFKFTVKEAVARLDGKDYGPAWRVHFSTRPDRPVFTLDRKLERSRKDFGQDQIRSRQIREVVPAGSGMAQCLTVEGSLYLVGEDLVVTHNCFGEGRGTAATIDRINASRANILEWLDERKRIGYNVEKIILANMGDPTENTQGSYLNQSYTVDLNMRDQLTLAIDTTLEWIRDFAPLAPSLEYASVLCNHGQMSRGNGKSNVTDDADNASGFIGDTLQTVARQIPGLASMTWAVPRDEMITRVTGSGVNMPLAHGHKITGAEQGWLAKQSNALNHEGWRPDLWVTAHRHSMKVEDFGPYSRIQCTTVDPGSKNFTDATGIYATPGTTVFLAGAHLPRKFAEHAVL